MLLSFTDFLAFKQMFLDYKAVSIDSLVSYLRHENQGVKQVDWDPITMLKEKCSGEGKLKSSLGLGYFK